MIGVVDHSAVVGNSTQTQPRVGMGQAGRGRHERQEVWGDWGQVVEKRSGHIAVVSTSGSQQGCSCADVFSSVW